MVGWSESVHQIPILHIGIAVARLHGKVQNKCPRQTYHGELQFRHDQIRSRKQSRGRTSSSLCGRRPWDCPVHSPGHRPNTKADMTNGPSRVVFCRPEQALLYMGVTEDIMDWEVLRAPLSRFALSTLLF